MGQIWVGTGQWTCIDMFKIHQTKVSLIPSLKGRVCEVTVQKHTFGEELPTDSMLKHNVQGLHRYAKRIPRRSLLYKQHHHAGASRRQER